MKRERLFKRFVLVLAAVFVAALWSVSAGAADEKPVPKGPSLYERLGGVNNIAVLIDDVIERSYVDPVFKANPLIEEAHKRYPKAAYKYNATSWPAWLWEGRRNIRDAP